MRRTVYLTIAAAAAVIAAGVSTFSQGPKAQVIPMPSAASFRILLGVGDTQPTRWDGSATVSPGRILSIQGWRFAANDSADASAWKASTRATTERKGRAGAMTENGVIVSVADDPTAVIDIKTARGNFSFKAWDAASGKRLSFLNGQVSVDRVPTTLQLTDSPDEQDFPAIAQSGDAVYLSYVEFVHSDRSLESHKQFEAAPKSFDFLARPAGGDQVFLLAYSKTKRAWSSPIAVSAPKQDVMRTAVAVDGQKRVWVFWSANKNGNFDIYAKSLSGGQWSSEMRLTTDPGTDLDPVAATDAKGRVWVAWQGFRNHNLEVLATAQEGDRFAPETTVSFSRASDWDPSIATASNGEVAVAWDTYDKGDYDVYFRRLKMNGRIRMDAPIPVAASQNFEARSSAVYDAQNRLWVAYEASDIKWGKDFGAYETTGVSLYEDHSVRVKCFVGSSAYTAGDLAAVVPHNSSEAVLKPQKRRRGQAPVPVSATLPDPALGKLGENSSPYSLIPPLPLNSFPRLAADPNGLIYLAFRAPDSGRSSVGSTAWTERFVYFDGQNWKGPVPIPHTDNYLDNRPGLAAIAPGDLLVVSSSDHRLGGSRGARKRADAAEATNDDLYAAEFRPGVNPSSAQLTPAPPEKVAPPQAEVKPERDQVAMMRGYRATDGPDKLQLMRGEFHRHTEISGDGGRDGPLVDAYRYLIDAASMDWAGCCDHDNGGREYSWWLVQKYTDAYKLGSDYVPMFAYERSVKYPEGHRNPVFVQRGIRPLPRLPKMADDSAPTPAPDTEMLYRYLRQFGGICASHTSATGMGTDWRDNDPVVEPVVEIYQGDRQNYEMPGAPRTLTVQPNHLGWVSLALKKGYRLGFQASSDHISTHMSYCNLWVTKPTREGILEAFHKRRVYGSTDDILADVHCGGHFMGEEFTTSEPPAISVKLWGTDKFAKVHIIRDGEYVYTVSPGVKDVDFTWRDNTPLRGKTSYYYVRGEQADGELVWVSPMWITYQ